MTSSHSIVNEDADENRGRTCTITKARPGGSIRPPRTMIQECHASFESSPLYIGVRSLDIYRISPRLNGRVEYLHLLERGPALVEG